MNDSEIWVQWKDPPWKSGLKPGYYKEAIGEWMLAMKRTGWIKGNLDSKGEDKIESCEASKSKIGGMQEEWIEETPQWMTLEECRKRSQEAWKSWLEIWLSIKNEGAKEHLEDLRALEGGLQFAFWIRNPKTIRIQKRSQDESEGTHDRIEASKDPVYVLDPNQMWGGSGGWKQSLEWWNLMAIQARKCGDCKQGLKGLIERERSGFQSNLNGSGPWEKLEEAILKAWVLTGQKEIWSLGVEWMKPASGESLKGRINQVKMDIFTWLANFNWSIQGNSRHEIEIWNRWETWIEDQGWSDSEKVSAQWNLKLYWSYTGKDLSKRKWVESKLNWNDEDMIARWAGEVRIRLERIKATENQDEFRELLRLLNLKVKDIMDYKSDFLIECIHRVDESTKELWWRAWRGRSEECMEMDEVKRLMRVAMRGKNVWRESWIDHADERTWDLWDLTWSKSWGQEATKRIITKMEKRNLERALKNEGFEKQEKVEITMKKRL